MQFIKLWLANKYPDSIVICEPHLKNNPDTIAKTVTRDFAYKQPNFYEELMTAVERWERWSRSQVNIFQQNNHYQVFYCSSLILNLEYKKEQNSCLWCKETVNIDISNSSVSGENGGTGKKSQMPERRELKWTEIERHFALFWEATERPLRGHWEARPLAA